jgi:hypothetical protein
VEVEIRFESTNFFKELQAKVKCHPTTDAELEAEALCNLTTDAELEAEALLHLASDAVKEKPKRKENKKPSIETTQFQNKAAEEEPYEPSEYEKLVAEKRQRNLEKLKELGLYKPKKEVKKSKKKKELEVVEIQNEVSYICVPLLF